ncbi:hydrogenase maturation nickel metallochaperone HypA [Synechococcus sp. CS-602]|uniref:hydrogenase maturation nickel metallochaperone HypA/HybF n=1 Tax=Synechococcaceae TaxID=1890426 RepID=UPI0008FF4EF0|nr:MULTISPECIES: hydrogenase maturation nickel metallochaperone HypA [Synechococcaceae]MCT4364029.1 hydrogenase maturation nickel metallochaperone HypA [Candidatus Regnicoccus frigidus MAG-AL1]APD47107.1 hypothetical protein BM449_00680 [Synechococcus sp. SynAce01]MCT0202259.1 hydrogenase maturation nickel metallochaperone HypA [Synechococcus sp. CS-603]MCT0204893.1 hydrogenase maturation nickel metallochaperone HypA [Synechococcus sp. CS-602]MCT0245849.1 hydrogenase maturation nickel metalloc
MHELALMEEVHRIALEAAAAQGGRRIHAVKLRVGRLAGADSAALGFAFEVVMAGGISKGATLELELVPSVCGCAICGENLEPMNVI